MFHNFLEFISKLLDIFTLNKRKMSVNLIIIVGILFLCNIYVITLIASHVYQLPFKLNQGRGL